MQCLLNSDEGTRLSAGDATILSGRSLLRKERVSIVDTSSNGLSKSTKLGGITIYVNAPRMRSVK
jgi:hypothetical protein